MEHGEVMLFEMTETDLEVEAAPLGSVVRVLEAELDVLVRDMLVVLELTNSDVDVLDEADSTVVAAAVELGDETMTQYSASTVFVSIVNVLDDLGVSIAQSGRNLRAEIVFHGILPSKRLERRNQFSEKNYRRTHPKQRLHHPRWQRYLV
jgi:alpha-ketoglutarate-dependent taurine dioxygenase